MPGSSVCAKHRAFAPAPPLQAVEPRLTGKDALITEIRDGAISLWKEIHHLESLRFEYKLTVAAIVKATRRSESWVIHRTCLREALSAEAFQLMDDSRPSNERLPIAQALALRKVQKSHQHYVGEEMVKLRLSVDRAQYLLRKYSRG